MANAASVDPSLAGAAQIPLQTFDLPTFPPEAQNLRSLTLTSDIALNAYNDLLTSSTFSADTAIPPLPPSIEALTLELFSLGYPPGWLTQLSQRLPHIKDLVVYSQLLGGITAASQQDAERFFENLRGLRSLHLLDVFGKPGFFSAIGDVLWGVRDTEAQADAVGVRKRLLFLEVSFTSQPRQKEFLQRLPAKELHKLVTPSLVTCVFNVSPAEVTNDPQDPTNLTEEGKEREGSLEEEGVQTLDEEVAGDLAEALVKDESRPRGLKVLNTTIYTLSVAHFAKILKAHEGLLIVSASVKEEEDMAKWKEGIQSAVQGCPELEQFELVIVPEKKDDSTDKTSKDGSKSQLDNWGKEAVEGLGQKCPKLNSFKANILRKQSLGISEWTKQENGTWNSKPAN